MEPEESSELSKITQFMNVTGATRAVSKFVLESAGWVVESAIVLFLENPDEFANMNHSTEPPQAPVVRDNQLNEEVRAPINPVTERIIESIPQYTRRRSQNQPSSVFALRDFSSERVKSDDPKIAKLTDLYKPPIDILYKGPLEGAIKTAINKNRFLLINIQDGQDFRCCCLNRDTWSNPILKEFIKNSFVFWQGHAGTESAEIYTKYHVVKSVPHIAILDPRTTERMKVWEEDDCELTTEYVLSEFHEFVLNYPYDDSQYRPPEYKDTDYDQMTEEEQMEAAIRMSLGNSSENINTPPDTPTNPVKEIILPDSPDKSNGGTKRKLSDIAGDGSPIVEQPPNKKKKNDIDIKIIDPEAPKCDLQLRLPNGSKIIETFPGTITLQMLHDYVEQEWENNSKDFYFVCQYPRKKFTSETFDLTLIGADLLPRHVLLIETID
eukprot:TRINITY_DN6054_c0_g1_i1.p1 TRINITY_DN6054_c0_g1~~TRINITY_DN6054_c0_g1_i1.p1  ORF type:complete len:438 (-),score=86.49 TRINITY_DN6054_c0_g1_i1:39-1352(-)